MSKLNKCKNYIDYINILSFVYCALEDIVILLLSGIQNIEKPLYFTHECIWKETTCTAVMEAPLLSKKYKYIWVNMKDKFFFHFVTNIYASQERPVFGMKEDSGVYT